MDYLNIYGLVIMIIIMVPNIVFAIKVKKDEGEYHNKMIEIIEQVGRFGSMFFMVFKIPLLEYGFWFDNAGIFYMVLIGALALMYCFVWILYFQQVTTVRAMALAILPTIIFLSSGILHSHVLLIVTALLFGIGHITITYNNNK